MQYLCNNVKLRGVRLRITAIQASETHLLIEMRVTYFGTDRDYSLTQTRVLYVNAL